MTATVIDRNLRRREIWVRECPYGNAHGLGIAIFRVKQRGPTNRTEPEDEPGTLIADPRVLSRSTIYLVRCIKSCERGKDTAGSTLASEAMADADTSWLTFYFDS